MAEIISIVDDLDNTLPATKRRYFSVGKRRYKLDLTDENAEKFDLAFNEWIRHAKRLTDEVEPTGGATPVGAIEPTPVKGSRWWTDPPRPASRATGEAFASARRRVRDWARSNGWPDLAERGTVPHDAYDRWYDEVWAAMDTPSWAELDRREAESERRRKRPARPKNPARTA